MESCGPIGNRPLLATQLPAARDDPARDRLSLISTLVREASRCEEIKMLSCKAAFGLFVYEQAKACSTYARRTTSKTLSPGQRANGERGRNERIVFLHQIFRIAPGSVCTLCSFQLTDHTPAS